MDTRKYDVFISYRRSTGADDARLLQQVLGWIRESGWI